MTTREVKNEVTGRNEIWVSKLPKDKTLFDEIIKSVADDKIVVIEDEINLKETIDKEYSFKNCIFEKEVNLSDCIFKENIHFYDCKFKENTRFHCCQFRGEAKYDNTTFEKLVDFYCAQFYKPQQFLLTDFLDRAIFSNVHFHKEVQFLYCKVENNTYISFESARFEKCLDISRANFSCNVNFWNIYFEENREEDIFSNIKETEYLNDFPKEKKETYTKEEILFVYKQLRETYRRIKQIFYQEGNKIEGLKFYEKEMSVYEKELDKRNKIKKEEGFNRVIEKINKYNSYIAFFLFLLLIINLKRPLYELVLCQVEFVYKIVKGIKIEYVGFLGEKTIHLIFIPLIILMIILFKGRDGTLLLFNKYSNDFGTNWFRGVVFVLLSGLVVFLMLFFSREQLMFDFSAENALKDFVRVLNLVDLKPFDKEEDTLFSDMNAISYVILFIRRIFIGYGYYQTIQAFRKFGKSS